MCFGAMMMNVKIVSVYNNEVLPSKGLKSGHGQSFCITIGEEKSSLMWDGKAFYDVFEVYGHKLLLSY